jgi:hypothetical protein
MSRRIPYAVANYEKIVRERYYFVDKTRYIRELENYTIPVFLRPRRFGKSLWCSILECYYDLNRRERFEELFGTTDIGHVPTDARNSCLVMRFDFSIVELYNDITKIQSSFDDVCRESFKTFLVHYASYVKEPIDISKTATGVLSQILGAVERSGAPPVMIIVDEYDNFTNQLLTTRQDELYRHLTTGDSFLRTFYKAIKTGVGAGSVARVFITGVLPVTMDDLTSGFNIGQIITLKENTLAMMGFTQEEVDTYVDEIFADHNWGEPLRKQVKEELRIHYNGYRFLPENPTLYNSTICNYYLNDLVLSGGKIPRDHIDVNLKVDINWLRRLGGEATVELVDRLLHEGALPSDLTQFSSHFNREKFIQPEFFPMSLFFLGLVSFEDEYSLRFPNLTVKTLFLEYYNELMNISVSSGYTDMCRAFLKTQDFCGLFGGYWERYIGQIPAQAFDKANENFFRTTFYEICTRYLSGHLSFAIEVNRPSGRSDYEAMGRAGSAFEGLGYVVEFKHFSAEKARQLGVEDWTEARKEDAEQVRNYGRDMKATYSELKAVKCAVVYTVSSRTYRWVEVGVVS